MNRRDALELIGTVQRMRFEGSEIEVKAARAHNIDLIRQPPRSLRSVNPRVPAWLARVAERAESFDARPWCGSQAGFTPQTVASAAGRDMLISGAGELKALGKLIECITRSLHG